VRPHVLFNLGRLVSFALFGFLLGALGGFLQISLTATAVLTIAVSVLMVFLALQMLGFKKFRRFQLTMPKFVTRFVVEESKFRGRYLPLLLGALTILLPCGFTLTTQGVALTSGSPIRGGLIMLFFALGTLPILLMIGFSSAKITQKPHLSGQFQKLAGFLVLFFAVYNINAQLNVLGLSSLSDLGLTSSPSTAQVDGFAPVVGGQQVLKMSALAYGYEPNYFKIRAGLPARFEITDKGVSGCTNAVISKGLFEGQIDLGGGKTSVKEFTPAKPGRYKFSCWMGMVSGVIDVVSSTGSGQVPTLEEVPSGAQGCGGGGGCSGGCGGGCGNPGCSYAN
jgi:sulfite exporter TauE/SafE